MFSTIDKNYCNEINFHLPYQFCQLVNKHFTFDVLDLNLTIVCKDR